METYFRGTELKFKVELTAAGFSMAENDFEIEVKSGRQSVSMTKEEMKTDGSGNYYAYIDTNALPAGTLKIVATAHIPDSDSPDGVRNEVAKADLCNVVNP